MRKQEPVQELPFRLSAGWKPGWSLQENTDKEFRLRKWKYKSAAAIYQLRKNIFLPILLIFSKQASFPHL